MNGRPSVWRGALLLALVAAAPIAAAAEESNKWRIEVNHDAHSDGTIVFRVHPRGAEPIDVSVQIAKGTHENGVAHAIRDAFLAALPKEAFAAELDDGEDVLVKRHHGAANFSLMIVSTTVENVKIGLDTE